MRESMNIEDLKCCGNCKYRLNLGFVQLSDGKILLESCSQAGREYKSNKKCKDWTFDTLKSKDRKLE